MLLNLIQTGNEYNYKINVHYQVMLNGRRVWVEVAMYIYMLYMYHNQNPLYRIDLIIFKFIKTILKFSFVNFFSCPIFKRSTTKCHHFTISKVFHWSLKFSVNNFLLLYIITLWLSTWSFCSWSFKMSCAALNIIT